MTKSDAACFWATKRAALQHWGGSWRGQRGHTWPGWQDIIYRKEWYSKVLRINLKIFNNFKIRHANKKTLFAGACRRSGPKPCQASSTRCWASKHQVPLFVITIFFSMIFKKKSNSWFSVNCPKTHFLSLTFQHAIIDLLLFDTVMLDLLHSKLKIKMLNFGR